MKKLIFFFLLLMTFSTCQESNKSIELRNMDINKNEKLIDGIDFTNSIFKKSELELNKYFYKGTLVENLKLEDLLNQEYRAKLFEFLKTRSSDEDFKITLFVKLLLLRIEQKKDTNSFYLLIESIKDPETSYDGMELLDNYLIELFFSDIYFFIQQENKYKDEQIINYIMSLMDNFLVEEHFFLDNFGSVNLKKRQLFIYPDIMSEFTDKKLIYELSRQPIEKVIFSPNSYTGWKNETIHFTDISSIFGKELIDKLSLEEKRIYDKNIFPVLKKYIIRNYHVNDPDGYTNLREKPNTTSKILSKIPNGSYVCFIQDAENWIKVYFSKVGYGYIYKDRLE